MSNKQKKQHVIPPFYCCYLLQSLAAPRSFYIGSTPVPLKRLSQHNGLLSAGAFKTRSLKKRPWDMVCIVYGFLSKSSALQFEHALQHPHQSRFIPPDSRVCKRRRAATSLHHHLANIALLLHSNGFVRHHLALSIFHPHVWDAWTQNRFNTPRSNINATLDIRSCHDDDSISTTTKYNGDSKGGIQGLDIKSAHSLPGYWQKSDSITTTTTTTDTQCPQCNKPLHPNHPIGVCHHPDCTYAAHLDCLARSLLLNNPLHVLPSSGPCPQCSRPLQWHHIARDAQRRRLLSLSS